MRQVTKILAVVAIASTGAVAGTTFKVGPSETYRTPCAVSTLAADGDTVEIAAGDYMDDTCRWPASVTLRGVNGYANMTWTKGTSARLAYGQGIWVLDSQNAGTPFVVENITFKGARVVDRNGAGIRIIGSAPILIKNCKFTDNENGILSNSGAYQVTIENSEFYLNGDGVGYAHNIYINVVDRLTVRGSWFRGAKAGNLVKSRALKTVLEYNLIDGENSDDSWEIDISQGGDATLVGNIIRQGPSSQNKNVITAGMENPVHPGSKITLAYNTLISARDGVWTLLGSGVVCDAWNNILEGANMTLGSYQFPASQGNKAGTGLVGTGWKPLGVAIAGAAAGSPIVPQYQYAADRNIIPRAAKEKPDVGALDAGDTTGVPPPPAAVWALVSGSLPPGLTLQPNGMLTGTPAQSGTHIFTVSVTVDGVTVTKEFTLTVEAGTPPSVALLITSPPVLPNAKVGSSYSFQFEYSTGAG